MKKIFLDFEMNPIERIEINPDLYLDSEIIEIGAVMLDEWDVQISSFSEYVRPTLAEDGITEKITRLTGITTAMAYGADSFEEVYPRFLDWCGDDYEIYAWGNKDLPQIQTEHDYKLGQGSERDQYLFSHWKDYQKIYDSMLGLEKRLSLSMAVGLSGKEFTGRAHGALVDAQNTAGLYLQTKGEDFSELLDKLDEGKEECTMSLGNLLSGFKLEG